MSRNKREGAYCGYWRDEGKIGHRRVGNDPQHFGISRASLKQIAIWNKGAKHNG